MGSDGIIFARLAESYPDRIVLGGEAIYLDGEPCGYPVGTTLSVAYIERNGRRHVEQIQVTKPVP